MIALLCLALALAGVFNGCTMPLSDEDLAALGGVDLSGLGAMGPATGQTGSTQVTPGVDYIPEPSHTQPTYEEVLGPPAGGGEGGGGGGGGGPTGVNVGQVPTPLTIDQAASIFAIAFRLVFKVQPLMGQIVFALGQCALETGNFKGTRNWNFGGISSDGSSDYWLPSADLGPNQPKYFKSFPTAVDGAAAYWRLLGGKGFRHVLAIAARERYDDAAAAVVAAGWCLPKAECTANYQGSMKRAPEYTKAVYKNVGGLRRVMGSPLGAGIGGSVAAIAAAATAYANRRTG